ncbi:TetR/AcrR family transcriptional regulator [Elongatibacter sediminis]|uniref:TetR/AcrR family transcriptional regulator n=1 Tax=Elongatibacter sediminis TaxID=3119006 RepID=A0AAW9RIJ8_9GAMM
MNQDSTSSAKLPKTARGRRTREKLLGAAEEEFGARGYHAVAINDITRRAGVALGTFYVYFESKEEIYRALVPYMSSRVRSYIAERIADVPDRLTAERKGLEAFLEFVREHKGLYRIISEAEFVANDKFVEHYRVFAKAYRDNLANAGDRGQIREGDYEVWSWAIMGMAVFLGMRYGEGDRDADPERIADVVVDLMAHGIGRPAENEEQN